MLAMRKIIALTIAGAAILFLLSLIGSKVGQARRNSSYRAAVARFQSDLPLGTSKAEVRKYLDSHNIQYYAATRGGSRVEAFEIKIGEDPGGLVCEPWNVSVALEFSSEDVLRQIRIKREGTCS